MSGFLVHEGATVICMHGGQAEPVMPSLRVTVGGNAIATQSTPYSIAGCGLTGTPAPPCVSAQFVMAALRVTSEGQPVVLTDSEAVCVSSGTGLQIIITQMNAQGS